MATQPIEESNADAEGIARKNRLPIVKSMNSMLDSLDRVNQQISTQGGVTEETRRQLQADVMTAVMVLHPYHDRDGIDWQGATPFDGGPMALIHGAFEGDIVERAPRGRREADPEPQRFARVYDAWTLIESAMELRKMADDLGFLPDADKSTKSVDDEAMGV